MKHKKRLRILKMEGIILVMIILSGTVLFGTHAGRKLLYKAAAHFVHNELNTESNNSLESAPDKDKKKKTVDFSDIGSGSYPVRKEAFIKNFLLLGIEEIGGARNTDSMMLLSIDTKNKKLKMTSLMRDSYVDIPGYKKNKLNSAYAKGGINLLVDTIEKNYKIGIDGYADVNFKAFEKVIDVLGGVNIELSKEEAEYLNKTNYISKKKYRTVVEGPNLLNGNQALGYCRVRHVPTLEKAANDYGRTLRQRKVMKQIFDKGRTIQILKLIPIAKQCLYYVDTDLSEDTIEFLMEEVLENKISTLEPFRLPVDGAFEDPKIYENVTYPLVYNWEENIEQLFMFLYGDTKEEAAQHYQALIQQN